MVDRDDAECGVVETARLVTKHEDSKGLSAMTDRGLDPSIFSIEVVEDEEEVLEPLSQGSSRSWMIAGYGERARHVVDDDADEGEEERSAASREPASERVSD